MSKCSLFQDILQTSKQAHGVRERENSQNKLIVNVNLLVDMDTAVNSSSGSRSIRFLLFWFLAHTIFFSLFTGRLFAV